MPCFVSDVVWRAQDKTEAFLARWLTAHSSDPLGKPVILEEFGKWQDVGGGSNERDVYYNAAFQIIRQASVGGGGGGTRGRGKVGVGGGGGGRRVVNAA